MTETRVAFIGGSGLYEMPGLADVEEVNVQTPFGPPSDSIVIGTLEGTSIAFLSRHGRGHRLSPTELPARANIYALKSLGIERIISISAVGSLRDEIRPLDMVIPNQLIDRTKSRVSTFFGDGIVAHVAFAHPFCPVLSALLDDAARTPGAASSSTTIHFGGTYVVMEGPQFSTKAESELYRSWGASVIGMTALPEAKLAREAEICYTTLALATDYDVWHETEEDVTVEMIVANLLKNVATAQNVVRRLVPLITAERECDCASALKDAIITSRDVVSQSAKDRLALLVGKYLD